jgi:hypothetical protein
MKEPELRRLIESVRVGKVARRDFIKVQRTWSVSPSNVKSSDGITTALRDPCFFTRPASHAS